MPGVSFYLTPTRLRQLEGVFASSSSQNVHSSPPPFSNNSEYAYSAVDKSPLLNYVMRHCKSRLVSMKSAKANHPTSFRKIGWVWTASLMPPTIAPNMITLLGFADSPRSNRDSQSLLYIFSIFNAATAPRTRAGKTEATETELFLDQWSCLGRSVGNAC